MRLRNRAPIRERISPWCEPSWPWTERSWPGYGRRSPLITASFALDKVTEALHQARMITGTNWVKTSHLSGILRTVPATVFLVITSVEYGRAG